MSEYDYDCWKADEELILRAQAELMHKPVRIDHMRVGTVTKVVPKRNAEGIPLGEIEITMEVERVIGESTTQSIEVWGGSVFTSSDTYHEPNTYQKPEGIDREER